ncbi:MAG TPA: flagellar basal body rod protein FlgC [candidate division Zixibacteria bacterium]|nr:flagellar basal body rod protein FlgC [candidate division Zixibacteria bacterium]MDD4917136.1 flagellar basal body rod protein FlgC [candidate division Zixibacteria bacterium]MDM7972680.1 flagellar basal body rod protein FlgC [candidate division Zixibacteria bacterium]HOD65404.1 flagellar basal body rod protein FlgC [candidate division Zixibacteria bacterium]HOZ07528.1 flagellar basal body rod protein FlgC [candidate division Zixibacteria bacterium]
MAGILGAIEIASRGLSVQRAKMNATAENIANAETTQTPEGGPYRRKRVQVREDETGVSFRQAMRRAGVSLERTNTRHFPARGVCVQSEVEVPDVDMKEIRDPQSSYRLIHDPEHPDADEQGYVKMPDIEVVNEMVDMMAAARAYEANTVTIAAAKQMAKDALDI